MTFKVPAVTVKVLAMPSTALVDNCRDVPFKVTLKRLAVPLSVLVPAKVAVPAVAEKDPLTSSVVLTEKGTAVVTVPGMISEPNAIVPAPEMVLLAPCIVMVPPVPVSVPLTTRLPVSITLLVVLILPETVRLSSVILAPVMVFVAPVMVTVPPGACVNAPGPVVAKLPAIVIEAVAGAEILVAVTFRLLNPCVPVPLMLVPGPFILTVPVPPAKVPVFTQLPLISIVKLPPLKVVPVLIVVLPEITILAAAVNVTDVPAPGVLVRLPATVNAVAGMVFTTAPLLLERVRLP